MTIDPRRGNRARSRPFHLIEDEFRKKWGKPSIEAKCLKPVMTPETVGGDLEDMINHHDFDPGATENKCLEGVENDVFNPEPSNIEAAAGIVLGISPVVN